MSEEDLILAGHEVIDKFLDANEITNKLIIPDLQRDDEDYHLYDKPKKRKEQVRKPSFVPKYAVPNARESHLHYIQNYLHFYGDRKQVEQQIRQQNEERKKNFKSDRQMLAEQHQFLRDDEDNQDDETNTEKQHGKKMAIEYESKLYREFCVANLSRYKEGMIGLRWRTENEVKQEFGQDTCGSLTCKRKDKRVSRNEIELNTLEVNFAYVEQGEHKNALVKIRLCRKCTKKMDKANKIKNKSKKRKHETSDSDEEPQYKRTR
jgi:protein FRA10AC1